MNEENLTFLELDIEFVCVVGFVFFGGSVKSYHF